MEGGCTAHSTCGRQQSMHTLQLHGHVQLICQVGLSNSFPESVQVSWGWWLWFESWERLKGHLFGAQKLNYEYMEECGLRSLNGKWGLGPIVHLEILFWGCILMWAHYNSRILQLIVEIQGQVGGSLPAIWKYQLFRIFDLQSHCFTRIQLEDYLHVSEDLIPQKRKNLWSKDEQFHP